MDKEGIIINDINVSECNAYKDKHCKNETSIMFTEYNLCSNFPDCYYKQLQKQKEENEKLKQYLLNIAMIIEELEQQYDDIKDFTEIKEIKEILSEV